MATPIFLSKYNLHKSIQYAIRVGVSGFVRGFWNANTSFFGDWNSIPLPAVVEVGGPGPQVFFANYQLDQLPAVFVTPLTETIVQDSFMGTETARSFFEVKCVFGKDGWDHEQVWQQGSILMASILAALNRFLPDPACITNPGFGIPDLASIIDCRTEDNNMTPILVGTDPFVFMYTARFSVLHRYDSNWGQSYKPEFFSKSPWLLNKNITADNSIQVELIYQDPFLFQTVLATIQCPLNGVAAAIPFSTVSTANCANITWTSPVSGSFLYFNDSSQGQVSFNVTNSTNQFVPVGSFPQINAGNHLFQFMLPTSGSRQSYLSYGFEISP